MPHLSDWFRQHLPKGKGTTLDEGSVCENPEPLHEASGLHPSMLLLEPWSGPKPSDCIMEWDGSLYVKECLRSDDQDQLSASDFVSHTYPDANEEMFEWVDLLESIRDSSGSFTFVELGAGYGRWSVRAFNAAKKFGITPSNVRLITVEAEPLHSRWLHGNFELNGVPPDAHSHFECAVSDWTGQGQFYILPPGESDHHEQARTWYGQALVRADNRWEGAGTEIVTVRQLDEILSSLPEDTIIDLLDMDLQGEDSRVLESSTHTLSRVRKVHVGTDSVAEVERIFRVMSSIGWKLVRRYLPLRTTNTAYGPIRFVDGVMTWTNPHL